jgi:hypothetical protein
MTRFTIQFDTENAAFCDWQGKHEPQEETARILREIATKIEDYDTGGRVMDANGNDVGHYGCY